jgi:hypothetical protein
MKKLIVLSLLIFLFASCKKESSDFIWERSYSQGNAFFVVSTSDSGFVGCGKMNSKPYLIKLSKNKSTKTDFTYEGNGLFSSAWSDASCFIAGGSSNGKMLLARIDNNGSKVWDTTFTSGFYVDLTTLCYTGSGTFLAVGTASPDSAGSIGTGLLFVKFDTTGQIFTKKEITETTFIAASGAVTDINGNILLALTRKSGSARTKAGVSKYNSDIQKLWEIDLYNNPQVAAGSFGIVTDNAGIAYVSGKTEVARTEGTLDNSFLASISTSGVIRWKRYLENSNSGSALTFNNSDVLMMLNKNCMIINMANPDDGTDAGRIKMFSVCDSYDTDALGAHLDINYDGNILVAGSRGGNFYLALKASSQ